MDSALGPIKTIGRYAIFAEIASGGMASVHIGRLLGPVGFSRTVAVKRLHPQFARDPEFVTMFLDEARLAARIQHPNVVSTLDVVATQGELFLVMEYVHGESLAQLLRAAIEMGKPIPHDIVRTVMSGVLHGLHAAHEAKSERGEPLGIVHRDVSPQNILVGTDGIARILDFGVAKAASRTHVTRDRHIKGKLSYMAPEQVQNLTIDRRVDIYAASVVLWEMLTGKRLFLADSESSTLARVLTSTVPPPGSVTGTVSFKLDQAVVRGTRRNPEARFETARDMALALEASGRMATPSAVGEWVEEMAHLTLAARSADVAAVEKLEQSELPSNAAPSSPRRLELVTDVLNDTSPAALLPEEVLTELQPTDSVTSVSVEKSGSKAHSAKRRWMYALAGVAAVMALVGFGYRYRYRGVRAPLLPAAAGAKAELREIQSAAPVAIAHSAEPNPEPQRLPVASVASVPPQPTHMAQPELVTRPPPQHPVLTAPAPSTAPQPPTKASAVPSAATLLRMKPKTEDCDPPYTVDSAGIRHYKRKCL